ncbi:universal stress protein [Halobellus rarus]|uniref:Universal stress protein n=1 Tax=Halobellus rarus TaxID=1126237 RepID=A0ABD6CSB8_9EURY
MVIIAAVDQSDRSATVIREAESLAQAFDESMHIVHVVDPSATEIRKAAEKRDPSANFKDDAADIARNLVDLVGDLEVPSEAVGLMGEPAEQIVSYATEENSRYIVVAGQKRSPTGKAIFGSTSQSIILKADCPVVSTIEQEQ